MRRSLLGAAALGVGAVGGTVLGYLATRTAVDPLPAVEHDDHGPELRAVDVHSPDGTRLSARISGPVDAPALLLVHGLSLSQEIWTAQRSALDATFRVVTLDARGHGDSDDAATGDYAAECLGEDVVAALTDLVEGPCVVVGHSMGGMAVVTGLAAQPELVRERVAGVVLINSAASAVLSGFGGGSIAAGIAFLRERARSSLAGRILYGGLDAEGHLRGNDLATVVTRLLGVGSDAPPEAVRQVRELVLASRPHVAGEMWRTAGTLDLLEAAAGLDVPALVVAGQRDRVLPVHHSRRLADTMPDAELVELPDVGHVAMLERPDEVNALIEAFARRVLGPAAPSGSGTRRVAGR